MFNIFAILYQKNKSIVNLYQKELLGCFCEHIKMGPFNTELIKLLSVIKLLSENKTPFKIAAFGLQDM